VSITPETENDQGLSPYACVRIRGASGGSPVHFKKDRRREAESNKGVAPREGVHARARENVGISRNTGHFISIGRRTDEACSTDAAVSQEERRLITFGDECAKGI
jgi:hypothetical protein